MSYMMLSSQTIVYTVKILEQTLNEFSTDIGYVQYYYYKYHYCTVQGSMMSILILC